MKVLVTGAYGNLGKTVCAAAIKKGLSVIPVGREDFNDIEKYILDADFVVHAAGNIKERFFENPAQFTYDNLGVTADLLTACKISRVKKFFFVSSCAVYGHSTNSEESLPATPANLNGHFKNLSEKMIVSFCREHSMDFCCFRLFNLYGGTDNFSIVERLIRSFADKKIFYLRNEGESLRDFIHVDDAANIILNALSLTNLPRTVNVGTGEITSINDLVNYVRKKYGEINVVKVFEPEVTYSRADITLLTDLLGQFDFRSIFSHIDNRLLQDLAIDDD